MMQSLCVKWDRELESRSGLDVSLTILTGVIDPEIYVNTLKFWMK